MQNQASVHRMAVGGRSKSLLPSFRGSRAVIAPTDKPAPQCPEYEVAPEERASLLSRLAVSYMHPFTRFAVRVGSGLSLQHIPPLPSSLMPKLSGERLAALWEAEMATAKANGKPPAFRWALFRLVRKQFLTTVMLAVLGNTLALTLPLLTGAVVLAVQGELSDVETGLLMPAVFLASFVSTMVMQHSQLSQTRVAVACWGALSTLVLEHPSKMTGAEKARFSEGEVMNLLTVDCQAMMDVMLFMGFYVMMPFQTVVSAILLLYFLGVPFFAGLAILCVNVYLSERLGNQVKKKQVKKNMAGDHRSLLLNESLQGVRTIKLYGWEPFVIERVKERRGEEVKLLKQMGMLRGLQAFITFGLPTMAMVCTFVLYQYMNDDLSPDTVFISLGFFEFLNMGMAVMPNALNEVRRMLTSVDRIGRFLFASASFANDAGGDTGTVEVSNASFFWEEVTKQSLTIKKPKKVRWWQFWKRSAAKSEPSPAQPTTPSDKEGGGKGKEKEEEEEVFSLEDINIRIRAKQLVAIVGRVGSGKSTLVAGMLGHVRCSTGHVKIGGRAATVPQQAFVMNDTVKNNICFGTPLEQGWYDTVVKACALEKDIAMLPAGDDSEVGEKGITISGGQKQRLSIARAAYARPDIVFLDDPLSAMDAHVGREVFERCILGEPLRNSTRVMVTNQLQFCEDCDYVYVMDGGRVVEQGTHAELMRLDGGHYRALAKHVVGGKHDEEGAQEGEEGQGARPGKESDAEAFAKRREQHARALAEAEASKGEEGKGEEGEEEKEEEENGSKEEEEREGEGSNGAGKSAGKAENGTGSKADDNKNGKNGKGEDKKDKGKLMSAEMKAMGRVGPGTFFHLCRAADSVVLGYSVAALVVISPVVQYLVNLFLAQWSDNQDDGFDSKYFYLYLAAAGAFSLCSAARSVAFNLFFVRASETMHRRMLASVLASPMAFFDTTPIGRVLNRFTGDVMQLDLLLPRLFEIWAFLIGTTVVSMVVAGVLVPQVLVVSVVLLGVGMWLYKYVGIVMLELRRLAMMSYSPIMAFFSSYIFGLDSIRAFGRVELFFSKFRGLQVNPVKTVFCMQSLTTYTYTAVLATSVALFMTTLSVAMVALRHSDWVTPGYAGLILSYSTLMCMRVPGVFMTTTVMEQLLSAAQRLIEYIELPPEGRPPTNQRRGGRPRAVSTERELTNTALTGLPDHWPSQGAIEVDNAVMSYRPGLPPVLKGVSFAIAPGEKVGVVGRTGAGKSSLVLALFRMVELDSGTIRIDGQDIAALPLRGLRGSLGMIPQDPFLFSGTIRSNLDVYAAYSDAELWEALELVNLAKTVRGYEKGLEHEVKEKGDNFSAGMVQLFCLARVLLKNPKVIVMDEATASVDLATDALVQETIRARFSHCTIFTIAHRLNTVIDYDKILVMDAGTVAEFGTPAELLSKERGVFANLVQQTGESSANELRARAGLLVGKKGAN